MGFFVNKKRQEHKPSVIINNNEPKKVVEEQAMDFTEKIDTAEAIITDVKPKRVKKDKGLIERTESSKVILTEDNKQLLFG